MGGDAGSEAHWLGCCTRFTTAAATRTSVSFSLVSDLLNTIYLFTLINFEATKHYV